MISQIYEDYKRMFEDVLHDLGDRIDVYSNTIQKIYQTDFDDYTEKTGDSFALNELQTIRNDKGIYSSESDDDGFDVGDYADESCSDDDESCSDDEE